MTSQLERSQQETSVQSSIEFNDETARELARQLMERFMICSICFPTNRAAAEAVLKVHRFLVEANARFCMSGNSIRHKNGALFLAVSEEDRIRRSA